MKEAKPYFRDALIAFGRMSGWVAGPVILAVFLGKWLDHKYATGSRYFILIIGIGFFVSVFGILRESKKYVRMVEEKDKEKTVNNEVVQAESTKN